MTPWLAIVGLGEDGLQGLGHAARALVESAEVLVGGERHLAMVPEDGRERLAWSSPLEHLVEEIVRRRGQRICVLATGDPMTYGIGATLARYVPRKETFVVPAPSAFSLAAARLGWGLAETETLSLHGRPLELLHAYLQPGARLLVLCADGATPGRVAGLLRERGYGGSRLTVLSHMGGPREHIVENTAAEWDVPAVADFNTLAIACLAAPEAALLPRAPGLPDAAFRHDGQLTKREVRAATLAALAPVPGQRLWDVGAGCGSVAIEWMRAARRTEAVAVEHDRDRVALIAANAAALGTPGLEIVAGEAPGALADLAPPDAVFIGGGAAKDGLLKACWRALSPGGRLVANAVTLEGEQALVAWREQVGGELTRIAVSRAEPVGGLTGWRPLMAVTQLAVTRR
ncbi:MAG: precorrin-6y C5,15-methyltransferase (decarboxylating) subunit CbiE [Rhodospirillales bacterium]|nr:precorrin-6y C5,15-methyltransferase (decarboxylating) subunit CbiE [Rhodospirillales bacterium]MDH3913283.1 precorrin-6y C5,15-methyltransferase (decarboxylating) subunit CbiE [Rhodospirillales bacterium]